MGDRGRRNSDPTRCGSIREEDTKCQNKHVGRRSVQEKHRLELIQERERKNLKREQEKLRQEMRGKQGLTPSVDSYLYHQMGKRTGMRQKEYDQIARRGDGQRRAMLDPENFVHERENNEELDSWEEEGERHGRTTHS
jgi:hypothetical protein